MLQWVDLPVPLLQKPEHSTCCYGSYRMSNCSIDVVIEEYWTAAAGVVVVGVVVAAVLRRKAAVALVWSVALQEVLHLEPLTIWNCVFSLTPIMPRADAHGFGKWLAVVDLDEVVSGGENTLLGSSDGAGGCGCDDKPKTVFTCSGLKTRRWENVITNRIEYLGNRSTSIWPLLLLLGGVGCCWWPRTRQGGMTFIDGSCAWNDFNQYKWSNKRVAASSFLGGWIMKTVRNVMYHWIRCKERTVTVP